MSSETRDEMAQPWCPHCDAPIGEDDLSSPPVGEQDGIPVVEIVCARCLRGPDESEAGDE